MEQAELDVALDELESRLERLRALYEQYFMGIEKIEPAIARKDVDRRIYVLRREKIRNTAKRFKLQTIIQRYNTFQQYWQRICREIENGTYKRHLLRAQKNGELLTIAARKRLGKQALTSQPAASSSRPPAPASVPSSAPPATARPPSAAPAPLVAGGPQPATAPLRPPGSAPVPPQRPPLPGVRPATPPTASVMARSPPVAAVPLTPAPAPPAAPAPAAPAPAGPKLVAAPKPAPAKFESLDLDMDFMGDWDPGARRGGGAAKPAPTRPVAPAPHPAAAPPAMVPSPAKPVAQAPLPPAGAPAAAAPPPAPRPPAAPAPAFTAARPGSIPPRPVAVPPRPTSSGPPKAPLVPRAPTTPRVPPAPAPAPARVARPTTVAAKPAPAAAASPSVDDARLRELHSRLQQAKQQTKEANVSFEGLAKSIRATEAKLREQHKNRKIEFDVVIKDGKAVVKPIVR